MPRRLADVRRRIARPAPRPDATPGEITLIAVTKTRPASDVRLMSELGMSDVGENRDVEAAPKAASVQT